MAPDALIAFAAHLPREEALTSSNVVELLLPKDQVVKSA
jgi:hypothetical protein